MQAADICKYTHTHTYSFSSNNTTTSNAKREMGSHKAAAATAMACNNGGNVLGAAAARSWAASEVRAAVTPTSQAAAVK